MDLLQNYPDAVVRRRAARLFAGGLAKREDVVAVYQEALRLKGDRDRGKAIFKNHARACHRSKGSASQVGADLSAIRDRGQEAVLLNILDPNREVKPQFLSYVLVTRRAAASSTGMITAETANSLTLRKPDGTRRRSCGLDIEELRSTGLSYMPEGLEKQIDVAGDGGPAGVSELPEATLTTCLTNECVSPHGSRSRPTPTERGGACPWRRLHHDELVWSEAHQCRDDRRLFRGGDGDRLLVIPERQVGERLLPRRPAVRKGSPDDALPVHRHAQRDGGAGGRRNSTRGAARNLRPDDRDERRDRTSVHAFEETYGDHLLKKVGKVFPELRRRSSDHPASRDLQQPPTSVVRPFVADGRPSSDAPAPIRRARCDESRVTVTRSESRRPFIVQLMQRAPRPLDSDRSVPPAAAGHIRRFTQARTEGLAWVSVASSRARARPSGTLISRTPIYRESVVPQRSV